MTQDTLSGRNGPALLVSAFLGVALGALALCLPGCAPLLFPAGPDAPRPAPPVDFARALELGGMAFDLTENHTLSDEALRERYGVNGIQADVFSTTFPGDDGLSRFMLLTDPAQRRQTLVLAGTDTGYQWIFDALVDRVYQPDLQANIHQGWNTLVFVVYNYVLPSLRSDYSITVVGYSLGAALSAILSEYLLLDGYHVTEVVTFGQPRITDTAGARVFGNLPITRFVNYGDPFPYAKNKGSDGAHFGRMVVLYDGPSYAYIPAGDPMLEAGAKPLFSFPLLQFADHSTNLYRKRLSAKLGSTVQVQYVP